MISKNPPTLERVKELMTFDPCSGRFSWAINGRGKIKGAVAGSLRKNPSGKAYRQIGFDKGSHFEHRLVWLWVYGCWPEKDIDHIDGDPLNNRPSNLRLATPIQNLANVGLIKRNKHGLKGVTLKFGKYWIAKHSINGKSHHIGSYKTKEEAAANYDAFVLSVHGQFARTNKMLGLL